jgi:hypothetical protein
MGGKMKRSEMVQILIDAVYKAAFDEISLSKDEASDILKRLEKAGMIPPLEPDRRVEDCDLGLPEWEDEQ